MQLGSATMAARTSSAERCTVWSTLRSGSGRLRGVEALREDGALAAPGSPPSAAPRLAALLAASASSHRACLTVYLHHHHRTQH